MTNHDAKAFAEVMGKLGEVYGEEVSEVRARAYFEALADVSIERVRTVAAHLVKTSKFFPRPADFLEALAALAERPVERPALYAHVEPVDPALVAELLKTTREKLGRVP